MENGGIPRFLGARFVVGRGMGEGSRARRWTERKGEDATPAREEPPRSRSWQVASSPVVTALKPHSKASCRAIFASPEIDMAGPSLLSRRENRPRLFIYLFNRSRLLFDSSFVKINSFFWRFVDDALIIFAIFR